MKRFLTAKITFISVVFLCVCNFFNIALAGTNLRNYKPINIAKGSVLGC